MRHRRRKCADIHRRFSFSRDTSSAWQPRDYLLLSTAKFYLGTPYQLAGGVCNNRKRSSDAYGAKSEKNVCLISWRQLLDFISKGSDQKLRTLHRTLILALVWTLTAVAILPVVFNGQLN